MNFSFNKELGDKYKSNSQKIRVMSEKWVEDNIKCPCCGYYKLNNFENNKPVADFYCEKCKEVFELKSKNGFFNKKINAGAYKSMIERITSNSNPNLLILEYNDNTVINLEIIPKYFLTPNIIEARKPLKETARRAGWKGCNIIIKDIPRQGRISIITNKCVLNIRDVVNKYKEISSLKINDIHKRGWLLDVLNCVNKINKDIFTLSDVYKYENELKIMHKNNNNIQAKIRQQIQVLRDKGYIKFLGNGVYKKI